MLCVISKGLIVFLVDCNGSCNVLNGFWRKFWKEFNTNLHRNLMETITLISITVHSALGDETRRNDNAPLHGIESRSHGNPPNAY